VQLWFRVRALLIEAGVEHHNELEAEDRLEPGQQEPTLLEQVLGRFRKWE
jgi:hypothetical protein